MTTTPRSNPLRYAASAASVALATSIGLASAPGIPAGPLLLIFLLIVALVTWSCGPGPGIAAGVLAGVSAWASFPGASDPLGLALFVASCGAWIAAVGSARSDRRRRAAEEPDRAPRDVAERERIEATMAEQVRLAEYGREIAKALARSADLGDMLARCAEATVRHLDAAFARIWTVDEAGEVLELQASAGLYTHVDGPHGRVPVGAFKIGRIAQERRPHLTNAVIGDPSVPAQDWARAEGMVAFAGYPLIVEGRLVGVVAAFARRALSEATLLKLGSVADEIAVGIERKRAEERLRRQGEWLRVTLASIGDAVIATDPAGRVTFLNPVADELTGWSPGEAVGHPLEDVFRIVNEDTRLAVENPAVRALREGRIVGLANHTILISRRGPERGIEDSAAPIRDEQGRVVGAVLVFRDVTEARAEQRRRQHVEERFRALVAASAQVVWTTDPDGSVIPDSPTWREFTGQTYDQWKGTGWLDAIHPDDRAAAAGAWASAVARRETYAIEYRVRRADGVYRWTVARGVPVREVDGRIREWVGMNIDIDDRKRAEEGLRAAKEEAEQANEAKSRFLAVLSHELRTPLNPILLAASAMLERPPSPDDLRPILEMIRQNVNLQARLIDDLLDVMRIVRGKMPLHWEVVDGHRLIDQAVQICQSEVFGKRLALALDLAAEYHHLNADPARLQQVFWNLIRNALKFTPEGGSIAIRTRDEPGAGAGPRRLIVEVADTGIGIEPSLLTRVFDPFQQGETTITRRFGGLGLGLAICKGIVDAHGGALSADSPGRDRGTTFRLALNALPEATGKPDAAANNRATPAESRDPARLAILVVEDEPATLRLMARLLRDLGHDVATASTVEDGTNACQAGAFDLIISDIGLPDGSGLELIRRAIAARGPMPAIALTGYGMEEDIRRSREAGFTAHLTKPIDFTKLELMIRQVVPAHR